ncbi:MAG: hypothetical protein KC731_32400, partial [Myxococcales bacterium]|nr:hypothetical protein [Myxococcales bacterium]
LVYRAASEDLLDVEIRLQVSGLPLSIGYPQIFVRAQSSTIATLNAYDGYLFYIDGSATAAVLGRQIGTPFVVPLA